jgi:CBS domain-containing protein
MERGTLLGVVSTKEVLEAISRAKLTSPIATQMSMPVVTIEAGAPVEQAIGYMSGAHVSGLVVMDDGFPVGVFTSGELLEAGLHRPGTPVEEVMSAALLCMHVSTPLHRAAAQAAATRARRVVAIEDRRVRGMLTGLDFARVARLASTDIRADAKA